MNFDGFPGFPAGGAYHWGGGGAGGGTGERTYIYIYIYIYHFLLILAFCLYPTLVAQGPAQLSKILSTTS